MASGGNIYKGSSSSSSGKKDGIPLHTRWTIFPLACPVSSTAVCNLLCSPTTTGNRSIPENYSTFPREEGIPFRSNCRWAECDDRSFRPEIRLGISREV